MYDKDIREEIDGILTDVLGEFGLPGDQAVRLYKGVIAQLDDIVEALATDCEWPIQLIDRRYARWPGVARVQDLATGLSHDRPPRRAIESYAIDLAELIRRFREDINGAGDQGAGTADGLGQHLDRSPLLRHDVGPSVPR